MKEQRRAIHANFVQAEELCETLAAREDDGGLVPAVAYHRDHGNPRLKRQADEALTTVEHDAVAIFPGSEHLVGAAGIEENRAAVVQRSLRVVHAGRHLADFLHELAPSRHAVNPVEREPQQRIVETPCAIPGRIHRAGVWRDDSTRVVADQQCGARGHSIHTADLRAEVAREGFHLGHELTHELRIELPRGLLESSLGGLGPLVPETSLHEAPHGLHYTWRQLLLETVCFVTHGLAWLRANPAPGTRALCWR